MTEYKCPKCGETLTIENKDLEKVEAIMKSELDIASFMDQMEHTTQIIQDELNELVTRIQSLMNENLVRKELIKRKTYELMDELKSACK